MAASVIPPDEIARRIAALEQHPDNITKAAKMAGCAKETMQRFARKQWALTNDNAHVGGISASPERDGGGAYVVKGVSTYFDKDGNQAGQWVKTRIDDQMREQLVREFVSAMAEPLRGMSPLMAAPAGTDDDLLVVYPMGDPHFGMFSWAAETGDDFDLVEAERVTCAAIDRLVATAPNASEATLLNLGDFYHADDSRNVTPGHGKGLVVDTRYSKVMRVGAKAMRWCVLRLLEKHEHVRVRNVRGNHDPHAAFALAMALDAYFENNPRVTVDMSPASHSFQRFGKVLLGECHGDMTKPADLPGVMMNDAREHISHTTFWHWHCGHVHHDSVKEFQSVVVETHRTLATKDAWHAAKGYRSGRTMKAITYHREFGEVHRSTCDVAMLRAAA
jgi:hypothetical protein